MAHIYVNASEMTSRSQEDDTEAPAYHIFWGSKSSRFRV